MIVVGAVVASLGGFVIALRWESLKVIIATILFVLAALLLIIGMGNPQIVAAQETPASPLIFSLSPGSDRAIMPNQSYGFTIHITNPSDSVASFDVAVYNGIAVAGLPFSDDWPKRSFVPSPSGGQTSWVICDPQTSVCAVRWREETMPPRTEYTMEVFGIAPSQATYQGQEKVILAQVHSFAPPEYVLMAGLPMQP